MLAGRYSGGMLKLVLSGTVMVVALVVAGVTALGKQKTGATLTGDGA